MRKELEPESVMLKEKEKPVTCHVLRSVDDVELLLTPTEESLYSHCNNYFHLWGKLFLKMRIKAIQMFTLSSLVILS